MNILLLNDKYGQPGASSYLLGNLKTGLAASGHAVTVLTTHRTEENPTIRRADGVISIPVSYPLRWRHYLSLYHPHVTRMLQREVQAIRPDVVHAYNLHTYLTYDALRIAKHFTNHIFITMHDVMSIGYGRLNSKRFLDSLGQDCRITVRDQLATAGLQWNPLRNFWIRRIVKQNAKRVIAVSTALGHALQQNGIPDYTVIHNALSAAPPAPREEQLSSFRTRFKVKDKKVILFGGRISRDKGAHELLAAFAQVAAKLPEARILIAGNADRWRELLREQSVEPAIASRCICTGWLNHEDMQCAYAASDVVTTPSICLDTFNMMNLEAMAAGKPVVGTCFGGTPEVVQDGVTGEIVDPRNVSLYAEKLLNILTNETRAKHMGTAGRMRALGEFSFEKWIAVHENLYENS